jgi:hypothetical protein
VREQLANEGSLSEPDIDTETDASGKHMIFVVFQWQGKMLQLEI